MGKMNLDHLHTLIVGNNDNQKILSFLDLGETTDADLKTRSKGNQQPGTESYFEKLGKLIPETAKYTFSCENIMVNEDSGEIFSLHYGRYTFLVKGDFENLHEGIRIGYTLDDCVDVTELGCNWAIINNINGPDYEVLHESYLWTKTKKP